MLAVGLVGIVLAASASGGCSSASGGIAGSDAGRNEGGSGSGSGGTDGGSGVDAGTIYCFYQASGVVKCVGYGGLRASDCAAVQGTVVPSCPSAGQVGCCSVQPDYQQCWYCPSDPSQLQSACQTLGTADWTAGSTACGDAGGSSGGADGGAEAGASPYDTACTASAMTCPNTGLVCQMFSFGGGAITGYACTQTCTTTADCQDPSNPAVQCLPFTTGSFCVITCDASSATSCPGSLQCVANQGQTGICVSP